ncbi:MAG: hypothetical protein ACTHLO_01600 [Pseudolabrys sp.]
MDRFIARENIKHLRIRLESECTPGLRANLQRLLIEEEDKLGANLELLADLERHIDDGHQRIARQRILVAEMERSGHIGYMTAAVLLEAMIDSQDLHTHYRKRILIEIERNQL